MSDAIVFRVRIDPIYVRHTDRLTPWRVLRVVEAPSDDTTRTMGAAVELPYGAFTYFSRCHPHP